MREYDLAFSLGFACGCSQTLRDCGLQFASYPFDWVCSPGLSASVDVLVRDFGNWFRRENMMLWDVRITTGVISRLYRDVSNGFISVHDYSAANPIETGYGAVMERYARRIGSLFRAVVASRRTLAVYVEHPGNPRLGDDALISVRDALRAKFPESGLELLYFHEDEDTDVPKEECVADGIVAVAADYRKRLNGEILHVCRVEVLQDYCRRHIRVVDPRSPEERAAYAAKRRMSRSARFGQHGIERWFWRKVFRFYSNLEAYLQRQKLIPPDRPIRFEGKGL